MKILVTGGAGFIGSHIVETYLEHGHDVVVVDDLSTGDRDNLTSDVKLYEMDVQSPDLLSVFLREHPQVVNHQAGQVNLRKSVSDPISDAKINVMGSLNVIECARRIGVQRLLFASSGGAVYGEPERLPCREEFAVNPISPYGVAKRATEHYLFAFSVMYGIEFIALRYANVYGPRQDPEGEAGVVAIFANKMLANESVIINGSGEQERDFLYVGDCAHANLLALTSEYTNTILNIGTGAGISVNEVFALLKRIVGYKHDPIFGPPKIGETQRIYLDSRKANESLGWSPTVDFEEGLRRTVDSLR
jgi:UDP-glucose 4-epimerase